MIRIRRIYDPADRTDGYRVLVDRLWPRGVKTESAAIDAWPKAITPSSALRTWYGHRAEFWDEFQIRYRLELSAPEAVAELEQLRQVAAARTVTLLTATRELALCHAQVLKAVLEHRT